MDFRLNEAENKFRREVEKFILDEMPRGYAERDLYWPGGYGAIGEFEIRDPEVEKFRRKMGERGWLTMAWPKEYGGGGRSFVEQAIFFDIVSYYGAPGMDVSTLISGPTILRFGSEQMKQEWIPKIVKGDLKFWLAYSEPNAGSDLAAIQTRAVEDGDFLVVNGQKIWGSGAHVADCGWMVARTDMDAQPYKGTTLFIVDNKTPGITIRPIINIDGFHSFNEVFFDNVRVPKKNVVGEMNMGFYYLMVALDFERLVISMGGFRRRFEDLLNYAGETRRNGKLLSRDARIRARLAELAIEIEIAYVLYYRTAWMMDNNLFPNIEASEIKLVSTMLSRKLADTGLEIMGPYGQLWPGSIHAPLKGRFSLGYLDSLSAVIGAGTSEIQRNILAQRGLGLKRK
ncbi:MAG: acyl-CoA dehydrogenase family protein [Dehalococcoidia bacterium]|nr:acyl-CoA dehydrogenase family protein [Dehalococcoidia bacterium]